MNNYQHLGEFSDWVDEARRQGPVFTRAVPGEATRQQIRELMGFSQGDEIPLNVRSERTWIKDGVAGEEISWSVGFGPRTHAWFLKPAGSTGPFPGVLGLHDHGGFKYQGKEKIAEGPDAPAEYIQAHWDEYYSGRAWANALAKEGFAVLVHDTFLWGSRGFDLETMERAIGRVPDSAIEPKQSFPLEVLQYNAAASIHEHLVSKYCNLLGTSMAGVVSREDRIALNYLLSRGDVISERSACMGLSGGGNRAALLMATADKLNAGVIVGLMSTFEGLLDHNVFSHTWMLFPFLISRYSDWPDLAASRAPASLLVQFDEDDNLFTLAGMKTADKNLREIYASVGGADHYTGQFYPGPHQFSLEMQVNAFNWLKKK